MDRLFTLSDHEVMIAPSYPQPEEDDKLSLDIISVKIIYAIVLLQITIPKNSRPFFQSQKTLA